MDTWSVRRPISRRAFLGNAVAAALAPAVLRCGSATAASAGQGGPRLTSRPGGPTLSPSPGLTPLGLGGARDGVLYVPDTYAPDVAAPLFVALHGAGGEGRSWASYPGRAEERGMVLLAPDSRAATWRFGADGGGADVEFLDRALGHTFERCRIDPTRIALGGFSDGASWGLSLGVVNGDLFTHLVAYSPGYFTPPAAPVGKPSVFVSHGTADPILPEAYTRIVLVPELRKRGYEVDLVSFEGGHEVPGDISERALDWFLDGGSEVPGG